MKFYLWRYNNQNLIDAQNQFIIKNIFINIFILIKEKQFFKLKKRDIYFLLMPHDAGWALFWYDAFDSRESITGNVNNNTIDQWIW